jgi:ABC-2 type transport system permease protein
MTAGIEIALWWAIFRGAAIEELGGFSGNHYLAYALWAAFFSRYTISWMYEYMMIDEIDSGRINAILTRPISFYEFYLGQFIGYKLLTAAASFLIPFSISLVWETPSELSRFPLAFLLATTYLVLVHTMSFCVASLAFFYNRIHSLPMIKNIILWMVSGEIFPLDLAPEPFRSVLINLPFSAGTFVPVGYLTGRLSIGHVWQSFLSIGISLVIMGGLAMILWRQGRRRYSGTGA